MFPFIIHICASRHVNQKCWNWIYEQHNKLGERKSHLLCSLCVHLKHIFNITKYLKLINDRKQFYDLNFFPEYRFIKFAWNHLWSKIAGKIATPKFICVDFPLIFIFCMDILVFYEVHWFLYAAIHQPTASAERCSNRMSRDGIRDVQTECASIWMAHTRKKMCVCHCDAYTKSSWAKVSAWNIHSNMSKTHKWLMWRREMVVYGTFQSQIYNHTVWAFAYLCFTCLR